VHVSCFSPSSCYGTRSSSSLRQSGFLSFCVRRSSSMQKGFSLLSSPPFLACQPTVHVTPYYFALLSTKGHLFSLTIHVKSRLPELYLSISSGSNFRSVSLHFKSKLHFDVMDWIAVRCSRLQYLTHVVFLNAFCSQRNATPRVNYPLAPIPTHPQPYCSSISQVDSTV
jgi:hypothetical protein